MKLRPFRTKRLGQNTQLDEKDPPWDSPNVGLSYPWPYPTVRHDPFANRLYCCLYRQKRFTICILYTSLDLTMCIWVTAPTGETTRVPFKSVRWRRKTIRNERARAVHNYMKKSLVSLSHCIITHARSDYQGVLSINELERSGESLTDSGFCTQLGLWTCKCNRNLQPSGDVKRTRRTLVVNGSANDWNYTLKQVPFWSSCFFSFFL